MEDKNKTSFNLDELDRLEKLATPGPWEVESAGLDDPEQGFVEIGTEQSVVFFGNTCPKSDGFPGCGTVHPVDNANLVAALRNAYPEIAARLRALEAEVKAWRKWKEDYIAVQETGWLRPEYDAVFLEWKRQTDAVAKARKATDAMGGVT